MKREIPLIALIDNDVALNAAFSTTLTRAGYYTLPCVSGSVAAQVVVEELPELVIIALPMDDVMHLVTTMQACPSTQAIPIIVYADDWSVLQPYVVALQEAGCMVLHQATLMIHLLTIVEDVIGAPPLLARIV